MTLRRSVVWLVVAMAAATTGRQSSAQEMPVVLGERSRAQVVDRWLAERFETVVPMLMNREDVDVWVVMSREYNEDPVIKTMLPAKWMAARRRTILVFRRTPDGSIDRAAVSRYAVGDAFP